VQDKLQVERIVQAAIREMMMRLIENRIPRF
jgi:hypothetical protein